jgi:hypothetical protein
MRAKLISACLSATVLLFAFFAEAGCYINLSVENMGKNILAIDNVDSKARIKGLAWRKLSRGGWNFNRVAPGQKKQGVYEASGKCGKRREYRIVYFCLGSNGNVISKESKYSPVNTSRNVHMNLPGC